MKRPRASLWARVGDLEPRTAGWIALAAVTLTLLAATLIHRHLYADGGGYFLKILETQAFQVPRLSRAVAYTFSQLPLWLAVHVGIKSVTALSLLYGLGLNLGLPLALAGCLLFQSKARPALILFALASLGVCFGLTGSFHVSESTLGHSSFWPLFLFALEPRALKQAERAALALFCVFFSASYESALVLGPLLTLTAALAWRQNPRARGELLLCAATGVIACGVAAYGTFVEVWGRGHFLTSILWLRGWRTLWFSLFALALLAIPRRGARVASLLCALIVGLIPLLEKTTEAGKNFLARADAFLITVAVASLAFAWVHIAPRLRRFPTKKADITTPSVVLAVTALTLAACLHQTLYVRSWAHYTGEIRATLASRTGIIPLAESRIAYERPEMKRYWQWNWEWAISALSLALAAMEDPHVKSLIVCRGADKDPRTECPWQPAETARYERLARLYGIQRKF